MEPKPADRELVFPDGSVAAGQSFTITGLIGNNSSRRFPPSWRSTHLHTLGPGGAGGVRVTAV